MRVDQLKEYIKDLPDYADIGNEYGEDIELEHLSCSNLRLEIYCGIGKAVEDNKKEYADEYLHDFLADMNNTEDAALHQAIVKLGKLYDDWKKEYIDS